jgi:hypothetical protein
VAAAVAQKEKAVHVLVNNAGAAYPPLVPCVFREIWAAGESCLHAQLQFLGAVWADSFDKTPKSSFDKLNAVNMTGSCYPQV